LSYLSETLENKSTAENVSWCVRNRWLFNADHELSVGKDRVLVDGFHPNYTLCAATPPLSIAMPSSSIQQDGHIVVNAIVA